MKPSAKGDSKGVKFNLEQSDKEDDILSEEDSQQNESALVYSNISAASDHALKTFNECDTLFRLFVNNDPFAKKRDTVKGILLILDRLKGNP